MARVHIIKKKAKQTWAYNFKFLSKQMRVSTLSGERVDLCSHYVPCRGEHPLARNWSARPCQVASCQHSNVRVFTLHCFSTMSVDHHPVECCLLPGRMSPPLWWCWQTSCLCSCSQRSPRKAPSWPNDFVEEMPLSLALSALCLDPAEKMTWSVKTNSLFIFIFHRTIILSITFNKSHLFQVNNGFLISIV